MTLSTRAGRRARSVATDQKQSELVEIIDWRKVATRPCPVASSLEIFGDRWSMLIIRDVMNGVYRFDELVARLQISRGTLTDRLRHLIADDVLVERPYKDQRGRTRTEYRLSPRGWDLQLVMVALREWGDKHVLGAGNEPIRLIDRSNGHGVRLALLDEVSGEIVDGRTVTNVAGPGFKRQTGQERQ